jgi:folate-binding protein YgfZ
MPATTLADRALLRLSGEDVRGFLQGLVTNDTAALAPERPLWAGLLTPQGKTLFDFILWADGQDVLIDCEADQAEPLRKRLLLYRLRRPLTIERDDSLAVHWSPILPGEAGEGDHAKHGGGVSRADSPPPPSERSPSPSPAAMGSTVDPRLPELGSRWLAPAGAPAEGWRAHRLALGVPEGAAELGDIHWLECNAAELGGVSFIKGCYVGQENTARMNYRAKVNRRLVVVPADAPGPRTRIHYPELGLAVDHRRIDDLAGALRPAWLDAALGTS